MELYGPRAAQYQFHGRAEVSASVLSRSSSKASLRDENDEGDRGLLPRNSDETDVACEGNEEDAVRVSSSAGARTQGASRHASDGSVLSNTSNESDREHDGSMFFSAVDSARTYLRQMLEPPNTGSPNGSRSVQAAAEASSEEGGARYRVRLSERGDYGAQQRPSQPYAMLAIDSEVLSATSDVTTTTSAEFRVGQKESSPPRGAGNDRSAPRDNMSELEAYHLQDAATSPPAHQSSIRHLLAHNEAIASANPSVASGSVASYSTTTSRSTNQTPIERTRSLKHKRMAKHNDESNRKVMARPRRCSMDERALSSTIGVGAHSSFDNDMGQGKADDSRASRRRSSFSEMTDDERRRRYYVGEGSVDSGYHGSASKRDSLTILFDGSKVPKHGTIAQIDERPQEISFRSEATKTRSLADLDGSVGSQDESDGEENHNLPPLSWRLLWQHISTNESDPCSRRESSEAEQIFKRKSLASANASTNRDEQDSMENKIGASDSSTVDLEQADARQVVQRTQVRRRLRITRVACVFIYIPLIVLCLFFLITLAMQDDQPQTPASSSAGAQGEENGEQATSSAENSGGGGDDDDNGGWSGSTTEYKATILEAIYTTLGPKVGFDIFETRNNSGTSQAIEWIFNEDPLNLGLSISQIAPSVSEHDFEDLQFRLLQRFVLADLFFSSGGPHWTNSTSWLSHLHECEWYGVSCQKHFSHEVPFNDKARFNYVSTSNRLKNSITGLFLQSNNITTGNLTSHLGVLNELEVLNLSDNHIRGELSPWVGTMKSLEVIKLDQNELHGDIPQDLANLEMLLELRIENNNFEGAIMPRGVCQLPRLSILTSDCSMRSKVHCSCCTACFGGIK